MGDIARERLGIRFYTGDRRRHAYRVADLASTRWRQIHPVCHDLDAVPAAEFFTQLYRLAHPTDEIDPCEHASLGGGFDACELCEAVLLVLSWEIVVGVDVVAVHGCLPLPPEPGGRPVLAAAGA
ncbi:hypothetical protein L3Q65_00475 (plasmid) [Amycolatopsis sp. FU40]|uniref:hypothetical protein n=1 Tax=Amycolatopsis sp. FU40 TaxID=2914159 RepID=UPI001F2BAB4D|nr:hypothetical protein [Amycolatopsis sp. FU40]UKD50803.1 hypothetical protein L3Q65_00475 [Amycolatopsis sp. FU40]